MWTQVTLQVFLSYLLLLSVIAVFRFRHFEELHRRLKFFQEYNLHLPPKHFLSTGLDVSVIQERCKLLDRYLKVKDIRSLPVAWLYYCWTAKIRLILLIYVVVKILYGLRFYAGALIIYEITALNRDPILYFLEN